MIIYVEENAKYLLVKEELWFWITTPGIGRARRKRWKDDGGSGWEKLGSCNDKLRFKADEFKFLMSFST